MVVFWGLILLHSPPRNRTQPLGLLLKQNIESLLLLLLNLIGLGNSFAFLHIFVPTPSTLFCDNLSVITLACYLVMHQRTKHIEIDVHFVREIVAKQLLHMQFVSSNQQFADILTKSFSSPLFHTHCCNLKLGPSSPKLERG